MVTTRIHGLDDHLDRGHDQTRDIGELKGMEFADAIRALAAEHGYDATTVTISASQRGPLDVRVEDPEPRSLGYDISAAPPEGFAKRVLDILQGATDVYKDRNAVYKDNFRMVGKTMAALFPEGRPPLVEAEDYDRWHIFELIIVKLTRYANNYDVPHEDSLLDMLPYLGILGGLDQELRERFERERAKVERERLAYGEAVARRGRIGRDDGPNYEADEPVEPVEPVIPAADNDAIARHAEKQDMSWADAWRYFERQGYDMSTADPQYG